MNELDAALAAARAAGEVLLGGWRQAAVAIERKGAIDLVTEYDRRAEAVIVSALRGAFPGHGLLAEEGAALDPEAECRWIVDPLDGTTNFSRRYPLFAVSIALERQGELVLGVVLNPATDECFVAERGGGARLNGRPIRVSRVGDLASAVVASGFPYDVWQATDDNLREWGAVAKRALSVRCDGSAALDLCAVGCGRIDAYWEPGLSPWDVAAGALIVREAGGWVTDYRGGEDSILGGQILAAPPALHAQLRQLLRPL